ncbi:MerR family transcriptional regulator [Bacillus megaterium]|uniref:MerR family transcriptional regulator n=1 Tax=Priestia megaterium TaxID=1404 RepID=UPI0013278562|nr:MerR family transcriptional regulator [Priestia megaterium]MQR84349.1 MerR family transcriptional regulator [Priestia megaterium]
MKDFTSTLRINLNKRRCSVIDAVTNTPKKAYWTKEVADLLDINEGTVRKYARLMEQNGYVFHKNEHEQRGFFEEDILVLKRVKSLSKTSGVTLEDAVNAVIKENTAIKNNSVTPPVIDLQAELLRSIERHKTTDEALNKLMTEHNDVKELLAKLTSQLEQQQHYIRESLEQRDKKLLETIHDLKTEKKKSKFEWLKALFNKK